MTKYGCLVNIYAMERGVLTSCTMRIQMKNSSQTTDKTQSKGTFWVFFIPSLIGVFLFMAFAGDVGVK